MTNRPGPRDLRASDFDRDRVIQLLAESAADGRLTAEEHSERVERAYQARTLGELAALTTDLVGQDAQPIKLDGRRAVTGIFGRDSRDGRWVVPASLPVVAIFGEVELDLREALLQSGRIVVYATLIAGTIHLLVPDGVSVEVTGTAMLTRKISRTVREPVQRWGAAGPRTSQRAAGQRLPGTGRPGTGRSGTGTPGTGQPGTGQPGTGQPGTGQPGTGQPGSDQPIVEVRTVGFGGTIKVTSPKRPRRLGGLRRGTLPRG